MIFLSQEEWDKKFSKKKISLFFSAYTKFIQVDTLYYFQGINQDQGIFIQEVLQSGIIVFP